MNSTRKTANRNNSTKSTGPRTAAGKQRARANALRHGLASVVQRDPATSAEIERLARWICGNDASPSRYEHARAIAEEQIMLRRVDAAYVAIIERATEITRGGANQRQAKFGANTHHELPAGAPSPATPDVLEVLRLALPQLTKLDRHQQRALARRQRATRAFVAASVLPGADNSDIE
jgi:hypothetical protein